LGVLFGLSLKANNILNFVCVCVCVRVSKEKKITGKKITFNNPWQTVGDALWEENNTHNLIKPEQQYRHAATVLV